MTAQFDYAPLIPPGSPAAAVKWTGAPKYNFTGGNNDAAELPLEGLIEAVFDEVDAGIGGAAAIEVGRRLARLAEKSQVIAVTRSLLP